MEQPWTGWTSWASWCCCSPPRGGSAPLSPSPWHGTDSNSCSPRVEVSEASDHCGPEIAHYCLFFLLQAFCFQQIETKNCKRNPWSQNAELVCRNKRLQMCETANVKQRYLQTDSLAECIKWLLISGCLNLIKISKRF